MLVQDSLIVGWIVATESANIFMSLSFDSAFSWSSFLKKFQQNEEVIEKQEDTEF